MKIVQTFTLIILFLFFTLIACKKQYPDIPNLGDSNSTDTTDTTGTIDTVTVNPPTSIVVLPGKNRLKVNWEIKEGSDIAKTIIYWNDGSDSVVVKISSASGDQTIDTIINLPEGSFDFTLYNYDEDGNKSDKSTATGHSYGKNYRESIVSNRELDTIEVDDDFNVIWGSKPDESASKILLKYINIDGKEVVDTTGATEDQTVLSNLKLGEIFKYRTVYRPEGSAIDTFMTAWAIAPYVSMVDKSKMTGKPLPNDAPVDNIQYLWDGKWSEDVNNPYSGNGLGYKGITTGASMYGAEPTWITIDLGSLVQLDSFHINLYRQFTQHCLRKYELWGAKSVDGSGDWSNWIKLVAVENKKPSGSPDGILTEEDKEAWKKGSGNTLPQSLPEVRYIRIKCLQNYFVYYGEGTSSNDRNNYNFDMAEIAFWQIIK